MMPRRVSAWEWLKAAASGKVYWDDRYLADHIAASILDRVPKFMRSWPILKRWFWQQEELDKAREAALRFIEDFVEGQD